MVKEIIKDGNPLLKQISEEVSKDENVSDIIQDMFETCEANNGVGLAAIQIGIPKRILIISFKGIKKVLINAKIKKQGYKLVKETEGCLSYPGKQVVMERPRDIEVIYENELRDIERVKYSGFLSRIILHEMDHWSGQTII
jgi:peptide deformylase